MPQPKIITVFGATGFLGRYVVRQLLKKNYIVQIPARHIHQPHQFKTQGKLGSIKAIKCDVNQLRKISDLQPFIQNSHGVINLVGILHETKTQKFTNLHTRFPRLLAKACDHFHVKKFIHISALGVYQHSLSHYARTKEKGERTLQTLFPQTTVLKPSLIFGPEDQFFNLFAQMMQISPFVPLIGAKLSWRSKDKTTKFQPVYVDDVAKACIESLENKKCEGKTYSLGGPQIYSFKDILIFLKKTMGKDTKILPIPFMVARILCVFLSILPSPPLTWDQITLMKTDNIVPPQSLTLKDLNITPNTITSIVPKYLKKYQTNFH